MKDPDSQPGEAVLISGGSGYIGQALQAALRQRDIPAVVLSRGGGPAPMVDYSALAGLSGARAVVNLAGANIAGGRWTERRRAELRHSRLETTALLCDWAGRLRQPPPVFVSASAVGYYGDTREREADESTPAGTDFGATLCHDWERSLELPSATRTVILRFGVVLGPGGGALARMLPAFRLGLGGPLGDGRQWMSWIALDDVVSLILRAIEDLSMAGAYNAVAPEPVRNAEFARTLGRVLHRPAVMPMPAGVLRLLFGEMSGLLLGSQRVVPARLRAAGFEYRYPALEAALRRAV